VWLRQLCKRKFDPDLHNGRCCLRTVADRLSGPRACLFA
jgi:hypothetical protein